MAELRVDGDEVVLELSGLEKLGALHGDIRVPRSSIRDVRAVDDAMAEVRGLRAPGTGLPGVIALGTWRRKDGKDFVAVHRHAPGVVVELEGAPYRRLIVTTSDASAIAAAVSR
jgi:hypothetical protein